MYPGAVDYKPVQRKNDTSKTKKYVKRMDPVRKIDTDKDYSEIVPKEKLSFFKEVQSFLKQNLDREYEPENYLNLGFKNGIQTGSINY